MGHSGWRGTFRSARLSALRLQFADLDAAHHLRYKCPSACVRRLGHVVFRPINWDVYAGLQEGSLQLKRLNDLYSGKHVHVVRQIGLYSVTVSFYIRRLSKIASTPATSSSTTAAAPVGAEASSKWVWFPHHSFFAGGEDSTVVSL